MLKYGHIMNFNQIGKHGGFVKELKGVLRKTFKGFNCYEIEDADANYIFKLAVLVTEKFQFTQEQTIIVLEQMFIDAVKDDVMITIGWDVWSGCFLMAYDKAGDIHVQEIGSYLDEHLNEL